MIVSSGLAVVLPNSQIVLICLVLVSLLTVEPWGCRLPCVKHKGFHCALVLGVCREQVGTLILTINKVARAL